MIEIRLKELCKERGISFIELAEKVGVSRITIGNIDAGRNFPTGETLERIASVLGVSVYELFLPKEESEPVKVQFRCGCGKVHTITIE